MKRKFSNIHEINEYYKEKYSESIVKYERMKPRDLYKYAQRAFRFDTIFENYKKDRFFKYQFKNVLKRSEALNSSLLSKFTDNYNPHDRNYWAKVQKNILVTNLAKYDNSNLFKYLYGRKSTFSPLVKFVLRVQKRMVKTFNKNLFRFLTTSYLPEHILESTVVKFIIQLKKVTLAEKNKMLLLYLEWLRYRDSHKDQYHFRSSYEANIAALDYIQYHMPGLKIDLVDEFDENFQI